MKERGHHTQWYASAAVIGIAVYVAVDVVLVFLRPHLSVLHSAESDYGSAGRYGWLMDVNFVLRCFLSLAVVLALVTVAAKSIRLRVASSCLIVWAVASGLLAFFPDDPVGTKPHGLARVHLVLAVIAFPAIVIGTRVATRALRSDPTWTRVAPLLTTLSWGALIPLLLLIHAHLRPHSLGGLYEKVFLLVELAWFLTVALWVRRDAAEADEGLAATINPV